MPKRAELISRANKTTDAINHAWDTVNGIIRPLSINMDAAHGFTVHLRNCRDLKDIPGEEVSVSLINDPDYPMLKAKLLKQYQGVAFICFADEHELKNFIRERRQLGNGIVN